MPLVRSYTSQWSSRFHRIPMLLPACSMVYLIALLCGGRLIAPPCIRSLPLLIWSLVHLPIILHMMEMHDTVEVSRGVGCETNMYLFPIVVDFVIDSLSIAEDIVPCDTHGPVVHPDGEELVLQARHRRKEERTFCQLLRKKCLINCMVPICNSEKCGRGERVPSRYLQ